MKIKLFIILGFSFFYSNAQFTQNVTFNHDGHLVKATISAPANTKKYPVVIINPGTGANNRDGTITIGSSENEQCLHPGLKGQTLRIYKDLEAPLLAAGYAVLRYDKLEYTYPNLSPITFHKLWLPVESAIEFVKTLSYIDGDNIVLMGHSEGSSIIPYLAKNKSEIRALISLAGPANTFDSLFAYQINYIADTCNQDTADAREQADQILMYYNEVRKGTPGLPDLFGVSAAVWKDYFNAFDDVPALYNQANKNTLIVGLQFDYNVPPVEFQKFKNRISIPADFYSIPGLNHYMTPLNDPNVSKVLTDTVVYWLKRHVFQTSVPDAEKTSFSIYPNPVKEKITIQLNTIDQISWNIKTINGVLVKTGTNEKREFEISVEDLKAGIYFISIQSGSGIKTGKIIINNN